MAADAFAAYPDHNTWFDVYTDASDFQLGAAYFSRNLNKAQKTIPPWKRNSFPL